MDDSDIFSLPHHMPTPSRPLMGWTILVVEDSLYASDAVRLLCLRSGARIRRADCLASARRHLQVYRPSAIIVDLGLPDGSGLGLIAELNAAVPRIPVIIAVSGEDTVAQAALDAGADRFLAKPIHSLAQFQEAVLSGSESDASRPLVLRHAGDVTVTPDPVAYRDDMAHAEEILRDDSEDAALDYVARFLGGVARSAGDSALERAAAHVIEARASGMPVTPFAAQMAGLVRERMQTTDKTLVGMAG
ncbi:response regulator transcription factor [Jhaorihella thermophila]|uniref:Response regulator receiver domain-containing protein n=1 Tax=Jhaorihella thermophila TaxID=488547 RepID=A0A1H5YQX9_9RHOB|nr:response regulator [Jhaorihella thermophila]SEG25766.1 Response regulator receiver domain-containing protein [Jhaorihella thermophila]